MAGTHSGVPGFGDRVLFAQGEIGRDFEADETVEALGAVKHRAEHFGGVLNVGDRHGFVEGIGVVLAGGGELLELIVVIGA